MSIQSLLAGSRPPAPTQEMQQSVWSVSQPVALGRGAETVVLNGQVRSICPDLPLLAV